MYPLFHSRFVDVAAETKQTQFKKQKLEMNSSFCTDWICQVLGSQVSVILATYVTAFLRHWANAYIW